MNTTSVRNFLKQYSPIVLTVGLSQKLDSRVVKAFSKAQSSPDFFQRRSCWGREDKQGLMASVIKGRAANPIHLLNREKSINHAKQCGDKDSIWFYNQDKHTWWNIDGQQRSIAIAEFFLDQYPLTGCFTDKSGNQYNFGNGKKFSELNPIEQNNLLNLDIFINKVEDLSKQECIGFFKDLNKGKPFTPEEARNALSTPVSAEIYELAKHCTNAMKKVCSVEEYSRMKDHRWLARITKVVEQGASDTGAADLDKFYENGSIRSKVSQSVKEVHDIWNSSWRANQENFDSRNYFLLSCYLGQRILAGRRVRKGCERDLRVLGSKEIAKRHAASRAKYLNDANHWELNGKNGKEPEEKDYFFKWTRWQNNGKYLKKMLDELTPQLDRALNTFFV